MFSLFRKKKSTGGDLHFTDIDGKPLKEGDLVESLRYELGHCKIVKAENGLMYESVETGKQISWAKMIDAATKNQKVRKT